MPIYAYRCSSCGTSHDVLQKISDAPLTVCPSCHEPALVKQVTAAGFQLKGSGWYVTDFRDKSAPAKNGADKAPDASVATGSEGSTAAARPAEAAAPAPAASAPAPAPAPAAAATPAKPGGGGAPPAD
jgi:putative FmdB family regulatory protein